MRRRDRGDDDTSVRAAPFESLVVVLSRIAPFSTYCHQDVLPLVPFMVALDGLWKQRRRVVMARLALLVVFADAEQMVWERRIPHASL